MASGLMTGWARARCACSGIRTPGLTIHRALATRNRCTGQHRSPKPTASRPTFLTTTLCRPSAGIHSPRSRVPSEFAFRAMDDRGKAGLHDHEPGAAGACSEGRTEGRGSGGGAVRLQLRGPARLLVRPTGRSRTVPLARAAAVWPARRRPISSCWAASRDRARILNSPSWATAQTLSAACEGILRPGLRCINIQAGQLGILSRPRVAHSGRPGPPPWPHSGPQAPQPARGALPSSRREMRARRGTSHHDRPVSRVIKPLRRAGQRAELSVVTGRLLPSTSARHRPAGPDRRWQCERRSASSPWP